jgi:hypothetical protein
MRACCRKTYAMARDQAARLPDPAAIRGMTPPARNGTKAVIALFRAKSAATLREIDRAISPYGPISPDHRQVVVYRARKVLAREGKHINSIYGVGYRLEDERKPVAPRSTPLNPVKIKAVPR